MGVMYLVIGAGADESVSAESRVGVAMGTNQTARLLVANEAHRRTRDSVLPSQGIIQHPVGEYTTSVNHFRWNILEHCCTNNEELIQSTIDALKRVLSTVATGTVV